MSSYDAIVIGARCAGAPLAMLLARQGRRVLAVDRATFPSDTVSTHFMWPRTTAFLAKWGLLDALAATGCPPIDKVQIHFGATSLHGTPDAIDGTAAMYCPRRTVLDALLVDAARRAGAEVRERTMMRELVRDGEPVVVGADGLTSTVAEAAGAAIERAHPSLTCGFYAYWEGVPTDGVEFYIREGRDVLVFPTHDGLTCIWVGRSNGEWPAYKADIETVYLAGLDPPMRQRVSAGRRATPFKGTHRLPNRYHACHGDGWALVGDAAYHRDPLTGMGIGDAFLGADLLARAINAGLDSDLSAALAGYRQALFDATGHVFEYTVQSAALKDPAPLAPLYAEIGRRPELLQLLMNVLAGSAPSKSLFNARTIVQLTGGTRGGRAG
jgi:flavin-dependent dehydrogenase